MKKNMEKHNVGDLVARKDMHTGQITLGYVCRKVTTGSEGYYVYFFVWDREIWYSPEYVDTFKEVLEKWKNANGQLPI